MSLSFYQFYQFFNIVKLQNYHIVLKIKINVGQKYSQSFTWAIFLEKIGTEYLLLFLIIQNIIIFTHQMSETAQPADKVRNYDTQTTVYKVLDCLFMVLYMFGKLISSPLFFILGLGSSVFEFFCKILKLGLTFVMNGIQGVQKTLRIGTFAQRIHYAVLKENGQYLKLSNRTLEEVFTCQLYDYGIRKFMSISDLEQDTKVTEIQLWSTVGLNFIKQKFKLKNVAGLLNSRQKMSRFKNKLKQISLECTAYSAESPVNPQDIFIFFNRSREQEEHKLQIDMIKVLGYIKRNLNEGGYAVIGNYFNCEGDIGVFEEILEGFGFKIEMSEDITPNIIHSRKVLGRIHKNRKIAWAVGKVKQFVTMTYQHDNVASNTIRNIWSILQQLSGIKTNQCKYKLYILQHTS